MRRKTQPSGCAAARLSQPTLAWQGRAGQFHRLTIQCVNYGGNKVFQGVTESLTRNKDIAHQPLFKKQIWFGVSEANLNIGMNHWLLRWGSQAHPTHTYYWGL
jgi:hypothetical protein